MRLNKQDVHLALALFCLLTSFYWLTASAHTYIADGETMYAVTEGLVERGTFEQPATGGSCDFPRAVVPAPNGHFYAVTSPLQSLLSIPFYLVGRWVATRFFPSPFYAYFTRFFVLLFNSPVHAATVALLYLFGIDLGYQRRTSLFLALTYGLATIAWPYARTFYAETLLTFWLVLTAWAAYRYIRTDRWQWMAVAGGALGLGVATKYVMAIAGLAFTFYFLLKFWRKENWRARWQWATRTLLAGAIPFLLIVALLLVFNYVRFGDFLETGYTGDAARGAVTTWAEKATPLISWYGYLFSSGKGYFFFSPPAILILWSVYALLRRRPAEVGLFAALALSYPLFYSLATAAWHGGGNWGPRYIVCITPFLLLPIGAFLERRDIARWLRVGSATLLFVLGFSIQLSTVFVNYSTYLFSDISADRQRWQPEDSTLLAQWRLWPQRVKAWQRYDHPLRLSNQDFYVIDRGFYKVEIAEMAPFGRWMQENSRLYLYASPKQIFIFQITYSRPRPSNGEAETWEGLHFEYDGQVVVGERKLLSENEREKQWVETLMLPASAYQIFPGTLDITARQIGSAQTDDSRALTVFVSHVAISSDGKLLPPADANLPRPLPVSTMCPWKWENMFWFYDPLNPTPFDMWPWYLWISGVPLAKARALTIVLVTLFGGGMLAGGLWFVRLVQRNLVIE